MKNAYMVNKEQIEVPWSKLKESLIKLLVKEGYLAAASVKKIDKIKKKIVVDLKYENGSPAVREAKRLSKPGRRLYTAADKIPWSTGVVIISTPEGLMTGKKARKKNLGGEVICQVSKII